MAAHGEVPRRVWDALASLKTTVLALGGLMAVVAACTLAQARLSNYEAVRRFIAAPVVYWRGLPVFPGGACWGALLLVNLLAAQVSRLTLAPRKAGLWLVHLGLIALFAGEFVASLSRVETMLVLKRGEPKAYAESQREAEAVARDLTGTELDAVPQSRWGRRLASGQLLAVEKAAGDSLEDGPVCADIGIARATERARVCAGDPPLRADADGRPVLLSVRARRYPLGYALRLLSFTHENYPGTDIPKSFASRVAIEDAAGREALISMNNPLRYRGRAFYQASYAGDETSILQVVDNPGWLVPYAACALVALGLVAHFGLKLSQSRGGAA